MADIDTSQTPDSGAVASSALVLLLARWRVQLTKYTGELRTALESGSAEEINVLNARCSEIGNAIRDLEGAGKKENR